MTVLPPQEARMIEGLPWQAWLGIVGTCVALLAWVIVQIVRGKLVPASQVERELTDITHDRDEWRAAHRISETARLEEREHNAALVNDIAKPVKEFLAAFRRAASTNTGEVD